VVGDVFARRRRDHRVVGVLNDEGGTWTVGSTARTSNSDMSGNMRATVAGPAVRRSSRAQVARISSFHGRFRIGRTLQLARSAHRDCGIEQTLCGEAIGACTQRIREDFERDERGGAGRMCCGEQRTSGKPTRKSPLRAQRVSENTAEV
jgi:hypothetical protein